MQIKQKSNLKIIFSDYVSTWHEVTSRQVGEKSDASKSLVPNLGTSSKIKKRTSACGRIDHKCYSKIIPDLEIILPIFCPFTKWQAGQTGPCFLCLFICLLGQRPQSPLNILLRGWLLVHSERFLKCNFEKISEREIFKNNAS